MSELKVRTPISTEKWMTAAAREQNEYVHAQVAQLSPGSDYWPGFNQLDQFIAHAYAPEALKVERLVKAADRVVRVTDVYGGCSLAEEGELRAALEAMK